MQENNTQVYEHKFNKRIKWLKFLRTLSTLGMVVCLCILVYCIIMVTKTTTYKVSPMLYWYITGEEAKPTVKETVEGTVELTVSEFDKKSLLKMADKNLSQLTNGVEVSEDYKKISVTVDLNTSANTIKSSWKKVGACLDTQLIKNNVDPKEVLVEYIMYGPSGEVLYQMNFPEDELWVDDAGCPLVYFWLPPRLCYNVFGLSTTEFIEEYKDYVYDYYTFEDSEWIWFAISFNDWQQWNKYMISYIDEAKASGIEVSEDYTEIRVYSSDISLGYTFTEFRFYINDAELLETATRIRKMCCLLQLFSRADYEEIEVYVIEIDSTCNDILGEEYWAY